MCIHKEIPLKNNKAKKPVISQTGFLLCYLSFIIYEIIMSSQFPIARID